jgi:hypothetical protein
MTKYDFESLKLTIGDYIWLMNEGGEGFFGYYQGDYDLSKQTFKFQNHSNGQKEMIHIIKLQRLQKEK